MHYQAFAIAQNVEKSTEGRLREQKQNLMTKSAEREGLKQRVAEMKEFLNEQIGKIEEYDEGNINCFIYGSMCMKYLSIRQKGRRQKNGKYPLEEFRCFAMKEEFLEQLR